MPGYTNRNDPLSFDYWYDRRYGSGIVNQGNQDITEQQRGNLGAPASFNPNPPPPNNNNSLTIPPPPIKPPPPTKPPPNPQGNYLGNLPNGTPNPQGGLGSPNGSRLTADPIFGVNNNGLSALNGKPKPINSYTATDPNNNLTNNNNPPPPPPPNPNNNNTTPPPTTPPPTDRGQPGPGSQSELDRIRNNRPRFGTEGHPVLDGRPNGGNVNNPDLLNSGLYERYILGGGDGNTDYGLRLKPEIAAYFREHYGWDVEGDDGYPVQIGVEYFEAGRIRDMSQVHYDPRFGLITSEANVTPDRDEYGRDLWRVASTLISGVVGAAAMGVDMGGGAGLWVDPNSGGFIGPAGQYGGVPIPTGGGGPTLPTAGGTPTPNSGGPNPTEPTPTPNSGGPTPTEPTPPPNSGSGTPTPGGEVTPPPNTPPPGPPGTPSGGAVPSWVPEGLRGAWQAGQMVWNGARWVLGALSGANTVSQLLGNGPLFPNSGGPNNGRGGPNNGDPNGDRGSGSLFDLLGLGAGAYMNNRTIQSWRHNTDDLINRGDWNRDFRPGYLQQLSDFELHPERALDDPGFQAVRDRELENLSRRLNARGLALSGNEMGELEGLGHELDWKQIEARKKSLRDSANLGDPRGMIGQALANLPSLYTTQNRNNAGLMAGLSRYLPNLFTLGANAVNQFMNWLGSGGDLDPNSLSPELRDMLQDAADQHGMSVQDFVNNYIQPPPDFTINYGDPGGDDGTGDSDGGRGGVDIFDYFFGDGGP
jgi:hypothetical protein